MRYRFRSRKLPGRIVRSSKKTRVTPRAVPPLRPPTPPRRDPPRRFPNPHSAQPTASTLVHPAEAPRGPRRATNRPASNRTGLARRSSRKRVGCATRTYHTRAVQRVPSAHGAPWERWFVSAPNADRARRDYLTGPPLAKCRIPAATPPQHDFVGELDPVQAAPIAQNRRVRETGEQQLAIRLAPCGDSRWPDRRLAFLGTPGKRLQQRGKSVCVPAGHPV